MKRASRSCSKVLKARDEVKTFSRKGAKTQSAAALHRWLFCRRADSSLQRMTSATRQRFAFLRETSSPKLMSFTDPMV